MQTSATIAHTCEKCGRDEVRYYTQQLRGADEGSTVFYECDCGHKYVTALIRTSELLSDISILQVEYEQLRNQTCYFIIFRPAV